jgi:hypothetical protein
VLPCYRWLDRMERQMGGAAIALWP